MRTYTETRRPTPMIALRFIGLVIGGAVMMGVFAFLFGYFVMLLWNWLMPEIFGLVTITFWQAFGIIILSKFLFGAFHPGHKKSKRDEEKGKEHFRNWVHNGKAPWRTSRENKNEKFSKWQYYEDYWEEEGKNAFDNYVKRKDSETDD
ncbi:MAG: hypothetical protein K9J13_01680 [Saprospiraceae bacterium]|nr:hypothetical protein [Saprospiraceae bacterium]